MPVVKTLHTRMRMRIDLFRLKKSRACIRLELLFTRKTVLHKMIFF